MAATAGANVPLPSSSAIPPVIPASGPVNVDNVARAIAEALNRLPPEQRADQFNAIRGYFYMFNAPQFISI